MGQVWYLTLSIPDLCRLFYFVWRFILSNLRAIVGNTSHTKNLFNTLHTVCLECALSINEIKRIRHDAQFFIISNGSFQHFTNVLTKKKKLKTIPFILKTHAAISNAHLFRVCKRGKLSGSCLSTLNGFGSIQLPIFLCHIGVPTFSSQNN